MGFVLNLFFALVELVGGLYTGSVAILSDALHDFGDSCSLGVAWYLERLSKKGRDQNFSYGYKRFSLLGALLISIILLVGSIFVITESIERIITPSEPHAGGMFVLALFGLAVNGYAAWRMMGGSSLNERAMRVHLMEDVLGWVAVLIVSVVMYFVDLPILDPILSLCITGWVLYNVYFNLRDNLRIFLQGVPEDVDSEELVEEVLCLDAQRRAAHRHPAPRIRLRAPDQAPAACRAQGGRAPAGHGTPGEPPDDRARPQGLQLRPGAVLRLRP